MTVAKAVLLPNACLSWWADFLLPADADEFFEIIMVETHWRQDSIHLFGKKHPLPRLQAWYGDLGCFYTYSGIRMEPLPWTKTLLFVRRQVELITGLTFNVVLVNLYRNGRDSNGWHADDEPELGENPSIASVSLGATRCFRLRHRYNKETDAFSLPLTHGSLLVMSGATQRYWQHCLTKTTKVLTPRINLTFRYIDGSIL
ncbi:hypothetical protein CI610_02707 [invertebrate metagenome]|uniref:Fe2OG dioxygenase domain-containing protein n=1 Tax=invertebrate metagenome TaxID=1711999 RepID=A0A2H9T565_9ZZZZ